MVKSTNNFYGIENKFSSDATLHQLESEISAKLDLYGHEHSLKKYLPFHNVGYIEVAKLNHYYLQDLEREIVQFYQDNGFEFAQGHEQDIFILKKGEDIRNLLIEEEGNYYKIWVLPEASSKLLS